MLTIDIDSFGDLAAPVISYFAGDAAGPTASSCRRATPPSGGLTRPVAGRSAGPTLPSTLPASKRCSEALAKAGAGNVSGLTFSGFENLTGAADNEDVFTLADGGGLSGAVDGGAGGFDSLVLAGGPYNTVDYQATDAHSGTIVVDGAIIAYAGLEPLTQTGTAANVVLSGSALLDVLTLGSDPTNDGNLLFAGPTIEIVSFPHPTESLTIRLGAGDDILTILDFDGGLGALLNVQGEDGYDSLLVFGTISTRAAAGGGAGDVDVVVENIALRPGAEILADASGSIDGNVSLVAAATGLPTGLLPGAVAVLDVDDATIRGGNVTLSASAAIAVDAASPGIAAVGAISAAIVTIGGPSQISASGDIDVSATSDLQTTALATAATGGVGLAASATSIVGSAAIARVVDDANLVAVGSVSIAATNSTDVTTIADGSDGDCGCRAGASAGRRSYGRNAHCCAPPAQIRTWSLNHPAPTSGA